MSNFKTCVKNKGRIRTKKLSKGKYQRTCILAGNIYYSEVEEKGKPVKGE